MLLERVKWEDLSPEQIRKMSLLEDSDIVRKIFEDRFRDVKDSVSDDEVIATWGEILEKAAQQFDIEMVGVFSPSELKEIIYRLVIREMPHR